MGTSIGYFSGFLLALWVSAASAAQGAVFYVDSGNLAPSAPFTNWSSAATTIQDAIDQAATGDLVMVTNGVYENGGYRQASFDITNRVGLTKALTVQSVNGPGVTVIKGYQVPGTGSGTAAVRCAFVTNGSVLAGFTLSNGASGTGNYINGGGVEFMSGGMVSNCILVSNYASGAGGATYAGGGAKFGTLVNCLVVSNRSGGGGGTFQTTLINCTVVGNVSSSFGGGVDACTVWNSIVYSNISAHGPNADFSTLNYCCTYPDPGGTANITNAPLFVDPAVGDFRLQSNSPAINSGWNAAAVAGLDLDGNPRIAGGNVDMGAYEFQTPASQVSYAWLSAHGMPLDGSADFLDNDLDGMNNFQEWRAGTNPNNSASVLVASKPSPSGTNLVITWSSVPGYFYYVQRAPAAVGPYSTLATNIPGVAGTPQSYTDTNAAGGSFFFYRVGVE